MCRLYAMRSNEPTRVECSLVNAQNALMRQSRQDMEGLMHGHGWGVADYRDGLPLVEKQTWAAFHGEHFAKAAARVYAHTVIAHVRRATVGEPSIENTHPFSHGPWIFAHNGTIPNFLKVRDRMMPEIERMFRNDIRGTTDSEHIFYYILSLHYRNPNASLRRLVGKALSRIVEWSAEVDPDAKIGLNVILTDGQFFVGSRLGRTLWHLTRESVFVCPICGKSHVHHEPKTDYRAVEIASEPITDDNWREVPDGTVYSVDEFFYLDAESIAGCVDEVLA
ncbi:class II glutamine amidotransferase [Ostreiculturibacter nitratireducens]|uniref:class II glutamine amidotransferase n=1 Tax=Ostreiculturibacter nitratireducens TaxID=3075226 RepID=UPI0031B56E35